MEADAAGEEAVDIRTGVIKATSGDPRQTHRESANREPIADITVGPGQPVAAINPDTRTGIDQNIGDERIGQQGLQRARSQDLGRQLQPCPTSTRLAQDDGLTLKNSGNESWRRSFAQTDLGPDRR